MEISMKKRIEFLYDKRKNKTMIFIWKGTQLLDRRELNGQINHKYEKKIKKEIKNEE